MIEDDNMKILHVITPVSLGGGETLLLNLINERNADVKEEVMLIYSAPRFEEKLSENNIPYYVISNYSLGDGISRIKTFLNLFRNIDYPRRMKKIIAKNNYDIIHTHGFPSVLLVPIVKGKAKTVYTHHAQRNTPSFIEKLIFTRVYEAYDVRTGVSNVVCDNMNSHFSRTRAPFIRVYNCIGNKFFEKADKGITIIDNTRINFVHVARFVPEKNHKLIVEAVEKLSIEDRKRIRVIFCGDGQEKNKIEKMVNENGVDECFVFLGAIPPDEVVWVLEQCDFGLLPSIAEGFGIAAVECMAKGLPVLALNSPLMKEIIGEAGYLYSPDEFERGFIEAIKNENDKKNDAYIKANCFKPRTIKDEYLKIYRGLLDGEIENQ